MFRLTFRRPDGDDDIDAWSARVRNAVPPSMFVAAYLEATTIEIYVDLEGNVEGAVGDIGEALGLDECRVCSVAPLVAGAGSGPSPSVASARPTRTHPGRIVNVSASGDARKLFVKVRHAHYEFVARVECVEGDATVALTAWVGSDDDDPRADYATLAQAFSDVTVELERPLGPRAIVYETG
jgi:hypothetical protein